MQNAETTPLSVSQLTESIKRALNESMGSILVRGEISSVTRPQSGHVYLTLKDSQSQIRAILWRSTQARIRTELEIGQEVVCTGRIDVYAPRGEYQLIISSLQPVGEGIWQRKFKRLYERLATEGLFDRQFKKPVPPLPQHIAVVTSPTGAAIVDFLKVLLRRWPTSYVTVVGVPVQGPDSAAAIASGLMAVGKWRHPPDVIVLTRGGGSIEDLWSFNEEVVVRAIFESPIPIVTGIGHEIDVTLADLVADHRAATPSETAEQLVPQKSDVLSMLDDQATSLRDQIRSIGGRFRQRLDDIAQSTVLVDPFRMSRQRSQKLDDLSERLQQWWPRRLRMLTHQCDQIAAHLEGVSPLSVLKRGYSLTYSADGETPIVRVEDVAVGDEISTRVGDGLIHSEVREIEPISGARKKFATDKRG